MRRTTAIGGMVPIWNRFRHSRTLTHSSLKIAVASAFVLTVSLAMGGKVANADATHSSLVSEFASFNTPGVVDGRVEAIAVDGDTVYVGGTFTQIQNPLESGAVIDQPYLFAYSKSSGDIIETFDPQLNSDVFALENSSDGSGVFVGGQFNILNGESNRRGLVKINIDGDRVQGFGARPGALVKALKRHGDTLYVGGNFDDISGQPLDKLGAVDTTTGAVLPGLSLNFEGLLTTSRTPNANQSVEIIDVTSDGRIMVIVGNFTEIDGLSRRRLAVIELDGQARVSDWTTDLYADQCRSGRFPVYLLGMDIAPDDSYFIAGSSGFLGDKGPDNYLACDTTVRFDLDFDFDEEDFDVDDQGNQIIDVEPSWVNHTGGDSVYDVVATDHAVYVGGHFRWLNNETSPGGDSAGPGSVERRGFGALDPLNGLTLLNWRADRSPRGLGTFALVAENDGIYIGDDTDFMNGTEHRKLKFLPVSSSAIARPEAPSLPSAIVTTDSNTIVTIAFDGTTLGTSTELVEGEWSDARGGMFVGGKLFHADVSSRMWSSEFVNGSFEPPVAVDRQGLTDSEWDLDRIGGMFFDYERGRVYYTQRSDSRLFWRAFTPSSPYFGEVGFIASDAEQADILWGDVRGMDVVDGHLYFSRTDDRLYRAQINGTEVVAGTTEAISGPDIDGRNWDNQLLTFLADGATIKQPGAEFEFVTSGSEDFRRFQRFEFPVDAGEALTVRLAWDNPGALLDLRVLDPSGSLVASDVSNLGSPKWLVVPAGVGGTYAATVIVREGETTYNVQINPDEEPPAPRADFDFIASGSTTSGAWQVFDFNVTAGELVNARVLWDDLDGDLRVFLRDETSGSTVVVDRQIDGSGSPAELSAIAETTGLWSVAVRIDNGAVAYDVLVDTTTDFEPPPPPLAEFEYSSTGSTTSGRWQVFDFEVTAGELVDARVFWDDLDGDLDVFLRDQSDGSTVVLDRDTDGSGSPAELSAIATTTGTWSVAVRVNSGAVAYDVLVDTTTDFEPPPPPLADFEFSSTGSTTSGRWQVFDFEVIAGELVDARILWDGLEGDLNVFLRDETSGSNIVVDRQIDGSGSPAALSAIATTTGTWSVAVRVNTGSVAYDVLVDTTTDFEPPPPPLAEFEFSSTGSTINSAWQVFNFDVTDGDLVDAEVRWDDPNAQIKVFLRDETSGSRIVVDRDTDGGASPSVVSAVATASGRWSIGVRISSDSDVDFQVLVNPVD